VILFALSTLALAAEIPCLKAHTPTVIPLEGHGEWLDIDLETTGPPNQGPRAVDLRIELKNGSSVTAHSWLGQQLGPYLLSGEDSQSVQFDDNAEEPAWGQRWRVATGGPTAEIAQLVFKSLLPNHKVCIRNVRLHNDAPLPIRTETEDWYTFVLQPGAKAVPQTVPVRGPATQAVQRKDDGHLYFENGQRARFWGVNLTGAAAIPAKDKADGLAIQLAHLGFNAVRFHHIDSNQAGLVNAQRHKPGQPTLNPGKLDDLDFFVSRLKAQGIYLFLEVATARELGPKDGLPKSGKLPMGHKLGSQFRPLWTQAYLDAFESLWGRTNPYTQTRYADEPAVALLNLSNEHSLLSSWGGTIEGLGKGHLRILDVRWNRWLQEKYADNTAINRAWAGSAAHPHLQAGEDLVEGSVRRLPEHPGLRHAYPRQRVADLNAFYAGLEQDFYQQVSDKADAMGFSQPRSASMSFGRAQNQQIYSQWDAADLHLEWDQTKARRRLSNLSALANPRAHRLLESATFAVLGQAFVVSELNHPFPNQFMAEGPLLWAAMASVQDWDALIWLDWKPEVIPERDGFVHSQFDLAYATVKGAQMPSASSLFRSESINPAVGFYPLYRSPTQATLQSIVGKAPLPWVTQDVNFWMAHQIRTVLGDTLVDSRVGPAVNGIDWNVAEGRLRLDQETLHAVLGPPGGPGTSRLQVDLDQWAAVSLATGTRQHLDATQKALLTVATQQENTGMAWDLEKTAIRSWGGRPILIEPAVGTVRFAWSGRPIAEVLNAQGEVQSRLRVRRAGRGWWRIRLDAGIQSPWIQIRNP
jgi:hypothetical protein